MSRNLKKLSAVILCALLAAAFIAKPGEAQKQKASAAPTKVQRLKPQVFQAVKTAESIAVKDMPGAGQIDAETQSALDRRVRNEKNVALDRTRRPGVLPSLDAAVAGKQARGPGISSVTPPPLLSFEGLASSDNPGLGNPPDTNADVGYTQIVETVNVVFRVYDKTGAPLTPVLLQSTLFAALGGICSQVDHGDPIVLHDRIADRWQISQFSFAGAGDDPPFHQCIAISKTSDAAGEYYLYDFITPGPNDFPDYPKLGVWSDAYYMSTRQFDADTNAFLGLEVYAFDRAKMLVGDPSATYVAFNIPLDANYPSGTSSGIIPSDHDGILPPPPGAPNVFAIYDSDEFGAADEVHLYDFHVDFTTPANSTFTERPESPVALPAFTDEEPAGRADIEEPAPGENLDSIPDRLMFRMAYRNRGGVESLVTNHTVNVSGVTVTNAATYQAASRYYEFRKSAPGDPYTVYDAATYAPDAGNGSTGLNRWMGSTAIDGEGNLAMGYSLSSTTVLPSIAYVGRAFNELGASLTNEQILFPGQGTQAAGSGNRWGDYTSMSVDPADDCTFWYANEYQPPGNTGFNWHTRIGSFKFPTCTAPAQGTLTGTITACDSGAPIGEVLIQTTGGPSEGFSAATADDGTYTIHLAPGTYTVTASSGIRNCQASASSVVTITDGNATTFNACLAGVGKIILPENDPAPATVSGGNGNGQIDSSECNMLNVKLQNAGCAPARNVVATLSTTTPGVQVSQPDSAYPEIPVDGIATNITPFKVSTSPSFACGTPIVFTLTTTHDGGTDVQTFTLQTCQLPPASFSGTIQAGDTQTTNGRLGRDGVPADCGGKTCPGPLGAGGRSYDTFSFVNAGGVPACLTVNTQSACGATIFTAAYLGSFDPANLCTNYLGDAGSSSTDMNFQVTVPAGGTLVVVVMEANAGTTCAYTGSVSGLIGNTSGSGVCPVNLTTQVSDASITLGDQVFDMATMSGGFEPIGGTITFQLFGPNNATCAGAAVFTSVEPVNGNSIYSSNLFTPSTTGTYRWRASYSGDGINPPVATTCNDANETVVVTAAPSPTPTATATATATPTATATATATATVAPAAQPLNLSTRLRTDRGSDVGIGGFTITDSGPKHVIIRAIGPSLTKFGFTAAEVLADPTLEVHGPGAFGTITNDNWRDSQEAQIKADGLAPTNDLESAIDATLPPGAYTAIVGGNGTGAGICLFEVYDLDSAATSKLANLSTRAFVGTGNNVVIAGFVLGNNSGNDRIVVRGLGPSLASFGIANTLADPTLELRDENGTLLIANNDWQDDPVQAGEVSSAGLAPSNAKESAIAATLPPGLYTAILSGRNGGQGVGTVEVYDRGP